MTSRISRGAIAFALTCALSSCATPPPKGNTTLPAFASENELIALFDKWRDEANKRKDQQSSGDVKSFNKLLAPKSANMAPPVAAAALPSPANAESVTNTQTAGVDEGGIVKMHGEHLVVLRRGRLFTIAIGSDALQPVAAVDAFGPDVDPRRAWYDEMVIVGDTIAVIGFSYLRGGTEIGLFDIDKQGGLRYRATYHLRSNDYYSSRNYASRLIGTTLIFYTPLSLNPARDPFASFPALRHWRADMSSGDRNAGFQRIAPATRIYRADDDLDPWQGLVLHSVTICELSRPELSCEASAVLGPSGRVFYVSPTSVYVWTTTTRRIRSGDSATSQIRSGSAVFRIPLDGSAPSALKTAGSPIDQFSFLESPDGQLTVLVRDKGRGDGMWAAEGLALDFKKPLPGSGSSNLALLQVPLERFGDGQQAATERDYRQLPGPTGFALQNRFVGDFLFYGVGSGWGRPKDEPAAPLFAVRWTAPLAPEATQEIRLAHGVDRIEALGAHALVVGTAGSDLHFSTIRLSDNAAFAESYIENEAAQGETRSHGFFHKAEGAGSGIIGLPVRGAREPGYRQLREISARIVFLRNHQLHLSKMGALDASPDARQSDGCRASCVDWYGNARPLFVGNRVFALMGYELVEGRVNGKSDAPEGTVMIREVRRINFSPSEISR